MNKKKGKILSAVLLGVIFLALSAVAGLANANTQTNIAFNPNQTGYPHPLESNPGVGTDKNKWFMVDGIISPGYSCWEGVAFTPLDSSAGEEEQQLTIDFGEPKTFYEVKIWGEYAEFWHRCQNKVVEYWNGTNWVEITDGSWNLEWRWVRFEDVHMDTSSTDWSPVYAPPYDWGRSASIFTFNPVLGSKVRVRCRPTDWFWLFEIEVFQVEKIRVNIDINPDTLELGSKGNFVTCYIEPFKGYNVEDINLDTVALTKINSDLLGSSLSTIGPSKIGDYDDDGISDLMVKFDSSAVQNLLHLEGEMKLTVTGEIAGVLFEGDDTVWVIEKGKK